MSSSSACESPPRHPRWQFSIRDLLIWTTAIALYFGLLALLQADPLVVALVTCWMVVVGIMRIFLSPNTTAAVSYCLGAIALLILLCLSAPRGGWNPAGLIVGGVLMLLVGGAIGLVPVILIETVIFVIRRVDARPATKQEQQRAPEEDFHGE